MKNNNIKIGIVIPWRESASRLPAFNKLINWYKKNMPNAEIFLSDRPGDAWSMSGSRNDGVNLAKNAGCDIIILSDADTFPQLDSVKKAIKAALVDNKIHIPYQETHFLYSKESERFLNHDKLYYYHALISFTECSGINIFTPLAWELIGGGDEKFNGWGYEDTAMNYAHNIIHGSYYISHVGKTIKTWHDLQSRDDVNAQNNKLLYNFYETKKTPEEILKLIKTKTIEELGIG